MNASDSERERLFRRNEHRTQSRGTQKAANLRSQQARASEGAAAHAEIHTRAEQILQLANAGKA